MRRRREARRLSRRDLAQRSGVSFGALEKLESRDPPRPRRATAIDIALALDWDLGEALALLDYDPLTADEQQELARLTNPRAQLDRMWDELAVSQQAAIVALVSAILNPAALPPPSEDDPETVYHGTEDLGDEHTEHEPSADERGGVKAPNGPVQNGPAPS